VALAHHADDQVETFWLRLLRGDVGAGLAGMRWKRSAGKDSLVLLVRPLLDVRKAEINEYARDKGLTFREDDSNADLRFQRNRIRHEIIPALEAYQPQVRPITLRAAETLAAEKEFLSECAQKWLKEKAPDFESIHPALQREIIRLQLLATNVRPNFDLIEELRVCGRIANPGPNSFLVRLATGEIQESAIASPEFNPTAKEISVREPGEEAFGDIVVKWEFADIRGHREAGVEYFDVARVGSPVLLRHWRAGDRFQAIGAKGPAKLQDLFTNLKVPSQERRSRVVAVSAGGAIFWVERLRIGAGFKVTPETKRILRWSWRRTVSSSIYP